MRCQVPGVHRRWGICLQSEAKAGRRVAAAAGAPTVSSAPGCLPWFALARKRCSIASQYDASMDVWQVVCYTYRYHEWYTRALVHGWTHLEVADNDTMCEDAYDKVMCMPAPWTLCCCPCHMVQQVLCCLHISLKGPTPTWAELQALSPLHLSQASFNVKYLPFPLGRHQLLKSKPLSGCR
jgi:hypothetical protein